MLRANDIVPLARNPKLLEPQATPSTSQTPSGKGEHVQVKRDIESGSEIDDEYSLKMREKALLVRFRFRVVNY